MLRLRAAFGSILLFLTPLALPASEVEVTPAIQVTTPGAFAAYSPTGIVISTGGTKYLYLYTQGGGTTGQDTNCPLQGDKIIAYRAPLDGNGNPLAFSRVGRVSPCVYDPESGNGMTAPASFSPGQIFQATVGNVTAYHLLADVSNARDTFHKIWHGWTTDGASWTWEIGNAHYVAPIADPESFADPVQHTVSSTTAGPFLQVQRSPDGTYPYLIIAPVLLSTYPLTNNAAWWGYLNIDKGIYNTTEILVDWSTGSPRVQYLLDLDFNFSGYLTNGVLPTSPPKFLLPGTAVKSLLYDAASGGVQLWGGVNFTGQGACNYPYSKSLASCDTSTLVQCTQPQGCLTGGGTTVADGATADAFDVNTKGPASTMCGEGFNWWTVTRFSIGSTNTLHSTSRYMPAGYIGARQYPFRWNSSSGTRYLFSATADKNVCTNLLFNVYHLMYTVESQVQIQ